MISERSEVILPKVAVPHSAFFILHSSLAEGGLSDRLAFLAANALANNANTFALVRFGRIVAADAGRDRTDELLSSAFDLQFGLIGDRDLDAFRHVEKDWVRVAQREVELLALQIGFETDALDFEILGVTVGDAFDHSGDDRTSGAIHGARETAFFGWGDADLLVGALDAHNRRERLRNFAFRTFNEDRLPLDVDLDLFRDRDGEFSNTSHGD